MATPLKEVLLVGYGAVGAIYALVLKRSGLTRVTVVARGNYESVNRDGMHIKSQKYGDLPHWRPDRLFKSVQDAADQAYSYVFVTTKALPEISPLSHLLAPLLSPTYSYPQPTYVLLQNGLGVEDGLYKASLGVTAKPKIVSTALYIGTNLLSENVVNHNDFDRVSLGMYRSGLGMRMPEEEDPEEMAILKDLEKILVAGGTTTTVVPEIQRVKFFKNMWNVTFACFCTLTRHPLPSVFQEPGMPEIVVPVFRSILQEIFSIGRAMGLNEEALKEEELEQLLKATWKIHERADSAHIPSMLLDLLTGKPLELEVILGNLVNNAKELGLDVPRLETIHALLSVVQRQLVKGNGKL